MKHQSEAHALSHFHTVPQLAGVGSLESGLKVRVAVRPWRDHSWIRRGGGLSGWGPVFTSPPPSPLYLDRADFQPLHRCLARTATATCGHQTPLDLFLPPCFFVNPPTPLPLNCSCCSSENTVSHGMSKHVWPSFLWTCRMAGPPSPQSP